jgi:tetratricopeptide (TPR) repeat protein
VLKSSPSATIIDVARVAGVSTATVSRVVNGSTKVFEKGKLPEAEEQARAALATESTRPMAYAILGAIRLQQKKYDESAEFLERALRLNP